MLQMGFGRCVCPAEGHEQAVEMMSQTDYSSPLRIYKMFISGAKQDYRYLDKLNS